MSSAMACLVGGGQVGFLWWVASAPHRHWENRCEINDFICLLGADLGVRDE
jgi:hypothetical protein